MNLRRIQATLLVVFLLSVGLSTLPLPAVAVPNPVATTDVEHVTFGRVFPDPQGCLAYGVPDANGDGIKDTPRGVSPYAKGRVCTEQFLGYDEVIAGARFLAQKYPDFLQVIRLDQAFDNPNYRSAGLPTAFGFEDGTAKVLARDRRPLYLFKVTDATSPIPERDRLHFAYSLSIHGIERAGLEGGIRAMEDLVTWAACERSAAAAPACAVEGPFPKPIVETATTREVPTAGDVLRRSVIYFVPPNPDGWHRGELGSGGAYFQRYNGNGVDLNRDWPTIGYTYRPYSPGSEPETQAYADVLRGVRDRTAEKRFAGGIDLHGQLLAVAFSFTLLGSGQRDFRKNFSTVDQSLRAWEDQTKRLSWSPYVADANQNGKNDPGESCPNRNLLVTSGNFPYCYADQWGTVVDTIGYQITGGLGDWFESPIGLGGVGIDNEMSMSHITPNTVYDPVNEQMHVDGNKGLIYSQLSSMLTEEDSDYVYDPPGRIGYVFNPDRLEVAGSDRPQNPGFPAQNDIDVLLPCETDCGGGRFVSTDQGPTLEFEVEGPDVGIYNGGITVQATFPNLQGVSPTGSLPDLHLETFIENQWQTVATSFIQGGQPDLYLQAGQVVTANDPVPGRWRVRLSGDEALPARIDIDFNRTGAEADPGQTPISATSMDFFDDLNRYVQAPEERLAPVNVDDILADPGVLDRFDSLVVVDDFMPGFVAPPEPRFTGPPQDPMEFQLLGGDPVNDSEPTHEFDVLGQPEGFDNDRMVVTSSWAGTSDYDVYVEQFFNGKWVDQGCECTFLANGEEITVTTPERGRWRVRVDNFAAAPQPVDVRVEFFADPPEEAEPTDPPPAPSRYTAEQFDAYAQALASFAANGGNLVLTDGALKGLRALGIAADPGEIRFNQPGGRGAVPRYEMDVFGRGNLCTPDSPDPLLEDVCLPGTAGGTARQAVEPAPLGYSPDATLDGAPEAKLSQYFVERDAWEDGCGKADPVECTSALLGAGAGLGERAFGEGRLRIAGAMLPDPNYAPGGPRDMRFGVASYALTFSAWQMLLNLVDYQRPRPDLVVGDLTTASKVRDGRTARVTATIANEGNADAAASSTSFVLDGQTVLGGVATEAIPAGDQIQVSVDWDTRGVKGQHVIEAAADVGGAVRESDEGNNSGLLSVTVQGNRVVNGSFEQSTASGTAPAAWTGSDTSAGTTSWSSDGTGGSRAVRITGTSGSVALGGVPSWTSSPITVAPGEVLDVVASVKTTGTSSAPAVGVAYLGATGQVLDTVRLATAPVATTGFVDLGQTLTVPAGVAEIRVRLLGFSPTDTSTSGTVVFDDVGVYEV
jgi:hypothetical protein